MAPGRPGKMLTPDASAAHRLGAELRHWRTERGLTQEQLGELLHHSAAMIGKIEKADRQASRQLCQRADEMLATGGRLTKLWSVAVRATSADQGTRPVRRAADSDTASVAAAMAALRMTIDRLDLPDDGPTCQPATLVTAVAAATEHRLQGRYLELATNLPDLVAEVARATHLHRGHEREFAFRLLTSTLRAADSLAFKFGYHDLSARLIDLMRTCCQETGDSALRAAVAYVRTESFFASGDLHTGARALIAAVDDLTTSAGVSDHRSSDHLAGLGALHMRAAVVFARAGNREAAAEHLDAARRAAYRINEGVYRGTAFGPASLRIHELAVAVELSDPAGVEHAATWHPPVRLPAERRSHYYIDLARAQLELGHDDEAHSCLAAARLAAPLHTRNHPQVRATVAALTKRRSPTDPLREFAEWLRSD